MSPFQRPGFSGQPQAAAPRAGGGWEGVSCFPACTHFCADSSSPGPHLLLQEHLPREALPPDCCLPRPPGRLDGRCPPHPFNWTLGSACPGISSMWAPTGSACALLSSDISLWTKGCLACGKWSDVHSNDLSGRSCLPQREQRAGRGRRNWGHSSIPGTGDSAVN